MAEPKAVEQRPVNCENEYAIVTGENLPNHSTSMLGRGKFVKVGSVSAPVFRTKQEAYRFCAWVICYADVLPDEEDNAYSFEEVREAIENY